MRHLPMLLACTLLLAACGGDAPAPDEGREAGGARTAPAKRLPASGLIAPQELERYTSLTNPPLVLDVRTLAEHRAGHVPGSVHVPVSELNKRLAELEGGRERGVILYCRSGRRAGNARGMLERAGFADLALIDGSMQAWEQAGLPIAKPEAAD